MPTTRLAQYAEPIQADSDNKAGMIVVRDANGDINVGVTNATGLRSTGNLYLAGTSITATTTAGATHTVILADATSAAITVNLPAVAGVQGQILIIKKIDSSGNAVTIDGSASETIDGATTKVLSAQWAFVQIQAKGSAWYIIG